LKSESDSILGILEFSMFSFILMSKNSGSSDSF
jgi:hypothetical protein